MRARSFFAALKDRGDELLTRLHAIEQIDVLASKLPLGPTPCRSPPMATSA